MKIHRCDWVNDDPLYQKYHDQEWGVPVEDDHTMFEFLLLESFQAGLSWYTILKKREKFFAMPLTILTSKKSLVMTRLDVSRLMDDDSGIIRNRQKIEAAINNAQCFIRIRQEWGDFCSFFWNFTEGKSIQNTWNDLSELPATTALSDRISKDFEKEGF